MDRIQEMLTGQTHTPGEKPNLVDLRILAGNSNPALAGQIASKLGLALVDSKIDRFSNQEIRVQIMENIRRRNMVIIQTGCSRPDINYSVNDFLMETFIMANACRLSSVSEITLVIPCFPYARQDKKDVSRAPISGRVVADLLQTVGVTRIVTVDLHASQIGGFFSIPVDNLYSVNLLAEDLRKRFPLASGEFVLVSPDAGGIKRMEVLAKKLEIDSAIMHKSRNHQEKSMVEKTVLIGKDDCVKDKRCIVIDDICDTAGTIIKASQTLMDHGARDVIILVVHGVLSQNQDEPEKDAFNRLNSADFISEVIVTNTLPQEENMKRCPKLKVIDISPLLSEAIRRLYTGESISELFN